MTASTMSSLTALRSISVVLGPSAISTLFDKVGDGGGVCSRASAGGASGWERFRRLLGCDSVDSVDVAEERGEAEEELEERCDFEGEVELEAEIAAARAASRAACVTGI